MSDTVKSALDAYVEFISSLEGVLRIYLFGSYARGVPHERSDIDLMVIIDDDKDRGRTAIKISKGLANRSIPLDVLVNRKTDFEGASCEPTIQRQISNEGVLLYAKQ